MIRLTHFDLTLGATNEEAVAVEDISSLTPATGALTPFTTITLKNGSTLTVAETVSEILTKMAAETHG